MTNALGATWTVYVGNASSHLNGSPAANPHQQDDGLGNTVDIAWEVNSVRIEALSSSASISYQRLSIASEPKNFRQALVNIYIDNSMIFAGMVRGQDSDKNRVSLQCVGFEDIVDELPVCGTARYPAEGGSPVRGPGRTEWTMNNTPVFNEQGKPDRRGAIDVEFCNDNPSRQLGFVPMRWNRAQIASFLCKGMEKWISQNHSKNFIRWGLAARTGSKLHVYNLDIEPVDSDYSVTSGVLSEMAKACDEAGYLLVSYPYKNDTLKYGDPGEQVSIDVGCKLSMIAKYDDSRKRNITYNQTAAIASANLDGLPWDISVSYDGDVPDQHLMYSGHKLVCTLLNIKPWNTTFSEMVTEDDGSITLVIRWDGIPTIDLFEGDKFRKVLGESKSQTFVSINPRITNISDIQRDEVIKVVTPPKYADDFEIYLDMPNANFKDGFQDVQKTIPMNSDAWEEAKKSEKDERLTKLESLNWSVERGGIGIKVSGFTKEGYSSDTDTALSVINFRNWIDRIRIPVTIEVNERRVVRAYRDSRTWQSTRVKKGKNEEVNGVDQMIQTEDLTMEGTTQKHTLDPLNSVYSMSRADNVKPIERVDDYESYESVSGSLSRTDQSIKYTEVLKSMAKQRLIEQVFDSNDSVQITIPLELGSTAYIRAANFPLSIGDWIDTISADSGKHAGYSLPRPMMVTGITYSQEDITIDMS